MVFNYPYYPPGSVVLLGILHRFAAPGAQHKHGENVEISGEQGEIT
jgi:hypothetical protein